MSHVGASSLLFCFPDGSSCVNREFNSSGVSLTNLISINPNVHVWEGSSDLKSAYASNGAGCVVATNTAEHTDIVMAKPGVTSAFDLVITKQRIGIFYKTFSDTCEVYIENGAKLIGSLEALSPLSYYSSLYSRDTKVLPTSYAAIDDFVVFSFNGENILYDGLNYDVAVYDGSSLLAVWGLDTSGLTLDFYPGSARSVKAMALGRRLRSVPFVFNRKDGFLFNSYARTKAMDCLSQCRNGMALDSVAWCKSYARPVSKAYSVTASPGFVNGVSATCDMSKAKTLVFEHSLKNNAFAAIESWLKTGSRFSASYYVTDYAEFVGCTKTLIDLRDQFKENANLALVASFNSVKSEIATILDEESCPISVSVQGNVEKPIGKDLTTLASKLEQLIDGQSGMDFSCDLGFDLKLDKLHDYLLPPSLLGDNVNPLPDYLKKIAQIVAIKDANFSIVDKGREKIVSLIKERLQLTCENQVENVLRSALEAIGQTAAGSDSDCLALTCAGADGIWGTETALILGLPVSRAKRYNGPFNLANFPGVTAKGKLVDGEKKYTEAPLSIWSNSNLACLPFSEDKISNRFIPGNAIVNVAATPFGVVGNEFLYDLTFDVVYNPAPCAHEMCDNLVDQNSKCITKMHQLVLNSIKASKPHYYTYFDKGISIDSLKFSNIREKVDHYYGALGGGNYACAMDVWLRRLVGDGNNGEIYSINPAHTYRYIVRLAYPLEDLDSAFANDKISMNGSVGDVGDAISVITKEIVKQADKLTAQKLVDMVSAVGNFEANSVIAATNTGLIGLLEGSLFTDLGYAGGSQFLKDLSNELKNSLNTLKFDQVSSDSIKNAISTLDRVVEKVDRIKSKDVYFTTGSDCADLVGTTNGNMLGGYLCL